MKPTILLFNIEDKSVRNNLRNIYTSLKINVKYVEKLSYNMTLGELSGAVKMDPKKRPEPYKGEELADSMIIFAGLEGQILSVAIDILKSAKKPFPYKAVMTDTTKNWTVPEVFTEIKAEHEALAKNPN